MERWMRSSAAVAAVVAACTAGCGGNAPSHAEFVAKANKVCSESNAKYDELFSTLFPHGDETPPATDAAPVLAKVVPVVDAEAAAWARFDAPRKDRDALKRLQARYAKLATQAHEVADLASRGDIHYLDRLQAANETAASTGKLAARAGFRDCAAG